MELHDAPAPWIHIGLTKDYPRGTIHRITRWNQELVIHRTTTGRLVAQNPTCPHLGAHLGSGTIRGECIECPFHGWQYRPDGTLHYVPGARRLPHRARLTTYPTHETGGIAFIHPHPTTTPPPFDPTIDAEVLDTARPRSLDRMSMRADLGEVQENAADSAHLAVVHQPMITGALPFDSTVDGSGRFTTTGSMNLRVGGEVQMVVDCFDPCTTRTRSSSRYYGSDILSFGAQIGPKQSELVFVVRSDRRPLMSAAIHAMTRHKLRSSLAEDLPVWEHKTWLEHPIMSDADGPLVAYRRWLSGFA